MLEPQNRDPSVIFRSPLVGIRPTDDAYDTHTGATFNSQSATGVALYDIEAQNDTIDFDLTGIIDDFDNPVIAITTAFGTTDFDVVDQTDDSTVVSDVSGFDTDVWLVDVSATSLQLRITNFDDTQAGFYPYLRVFELR